MSGFLSAATLLVCMSTSHGDEAKLAVRRFLVTPREAREVSKRRWSAPLFTPTRRQAEVIESQVQAAGHVKSLAGYTVAYVGYTDHGRKKIYAYGFGLDGVPPKSGADVLRNVIDDGGCGVITIVYDVEKQQLDDVQCNGTA
jgi:hypothetical protein